MGIAEITQGKNFKLFMSRLYGWGASIVIVGALFKIQHWPGAGVMLTLGLGVEAVIFFFSAFEPPHEETDWSLVYPELAGMHDKDGKKKLSPTQELDNMLEKAKIGPELLESVGTGLGKLSDTASKLSNISDASVATNEYVQNVKSASKSVGDLSNAYASANNSINSAVSDMSDSYSKASQNVNQSASKLAEAYMKASQSIVDLSSSNDDAKNYNEQVKNISKNLGALNAVYELQLQDSNSHLKSAAKFYQGISDLMESLNASLDDTKKYKNEISQLSKNLSALNTVYGNMLSAMNIKASA